MADIARLPSELEVGVFSDNLLSTQLDTQERLASLYNDFNVPEIQHSYIPKDWNTDEILTSPDLPKINDYLTSDDSKLRELAKNYMDQDMTRNQSLTKGFGLPNMVRYQAGQEKFTTDHWWSEKGKTKFGFDPYKTLAENEDFYHKNVWDNYSLFGKGWRGVGTFAGRTLSKLITGLIGTVGDIGSMAWNGLQEINEAAGGQKNNFWADVSDNWLARNMQEADNYVKNQILPTYKSINYDDKGAFSKLLDPYFWTNDLADGAGFLLQFAIPATMFGKAAQLGKAGKLGRFGQVMAAGVGELPTASRLSKGVGSTLEFLTGSRNVGGIAAHAFNTTMESVSETKEGFNQTVKDLMEKGYSEHEAKQIAGENAPTQFGLNMGILSASNAFENKWFQTSIGNRINPFRSKINAAALAQETPPNWVGKFFTKNNWGNRLYFYGGNGAKASIMEGYWEENAQLAAQRVAQGQYMRKGQDTLSQGKLENSVGFWKQYLRQIQDAASGKDREAADSIMAGAVIGILGGGLFSKFSGDRQKGSVLPEGERRRERRENAEAVAQMMNARDAWMSINVMPADLYKADGTIDEDKAKQRVSEINEKIAKVASVFSRKMQLETLTNQEERENLQYRLFGDFVKAHIMNGSADALVNRIKNWGTKSREELDMYGVTDEIAQDPIHWANVAQEMVNEYKNIDKINFVNPKDPETGKRESIESYLKKERAIKSLIFDYVAEKQSALRTSDKYAQLEQESNPFKSVDTFNSYNNLIARREMLKQVVDEASNPQVKDYYKNLLTEVEEQIDMRKKALPEHETGNISDMVFEKGSDVKSQENEISNNINEYLGYQFGKEDFRRAAKEFDQLIRDYSDPNKGIPLYNDVVDYWSKIGARMEKTKLENLGYTEAEISTMPVEQKSVILEENKPKEQPKEEPKEQEPQLSEFEQLRDKVFKRISTIAPDTTLENLDERVDRLYQAGKGNNDYDPEDMKLLTDYLQARVKEIKDGLTSQPEEAKQVTEEAPAVADGNIIAAESPKQEAEVVKQEKQEEEEKNEEPPVLVAGVQEQAVDFVPPHLLEQVRSAYHLHEKALENETSFKEEAERYGMKIHNNRIDTHVDGGKVSGLITINTSNPRDLVGDKLNLDSNNLARFNFLDNLLSERLNKDDFKIGLSEGKNEGLYGVVTDKNGETVIFGEDGMPSKGGLPILFYLDYDMFASSNINKNRAEVVIPPFPLAPLSTLVNPLSNRNSWMNLRQGGKFEPGDERLHFRLPIELHPSFQDKDVVSLLREQVKKKNITASLTFLTQGLLYREGTTNSYANIPKNAPTHTAEELWNKGHLREEKGEIPLEDMEIGGVYRRAHRIQFSLLRDLSNPEKGAEVAEFRALNLGEITNEEGQKIFDTLQTIDGKNLFQAAIEGNLEATKENIATLTALLRPDKFFVFNLGSVIMIVNLKKFKKFLTSDNISTEQLRSLTTLEELKDSEMNFAKQYYDIEDEVELVQGVLGYGRNNYSRFVNRNVVTSAKPLKKGNTEGYARINKRIALTLDDSMEDLNKATNQRNQENKSPDVTEVKVEDEFTDRDKMSIMNIKSDEELKLDDDFTKTECN